MNNAIGRTYFIDLLNNWSLEELNEYVALSNNNEYANIPQIKRSYDKPTNHTKIHLRYGSHSMVRNIKTIHS